MNRPSPSRVLRPSSVVRPVRVAGVLLAAPALLAACGKDEPPPVVKKEAFVPPAAVVGAPAEPPPDLRFTDVTDASGVRFVHETGADGRKLLPETMGSGVAFLDHDGDGDPDLLLLSGRPWKRGDAPASRPSTVRLWRNEGNFRFTEVTESAGLAGIDVYALGAACADADGDGDTDVVVTGLDGVLLLRNDGGTFARLGADRTGMEPGTWKDASGAEHGPFVTSAAWVDVDRDGRPDLFACHYVNWSEATDVWSTIDGKTKAYATPDLYSGESCRLWRNLGPDASGNVRFEDWTDRAKVRNDAGKSLGIAVTDLDGDPWPDLVVANDKQPNYLYCGNGDGTYRECGVTAGIANGPDGRARAGMGIDTAILGEKRRVHVAVGNFSGEPVSCFEWNGITFRDRSSEVQIAGPTLPSLTFGVRFLDADLDGRQDLLLANGHIEPTIQTVHTDLSYAQPVQLLRQMANHRFADITKATGLDAAPRVHRGLAVADVDGDGDLDVCVTVNGGPAVLLRNDLGTGAKSLRVRVVGKAPATDALGAKVTVTATGAAAGVQEQVQWVRSGGSYLSESERVLTFGLGTAAGSAKVTVRWPDGTERTFENVPAGRFDAKP